MKFLDLSGLTHFFGKVKTWAGNNYLSLEGGLIRGSVTLFGEYSLNIQETDDNSQRYVKIDYTNGISIGTHFEEGNETVDYVSINPSYISAPQFKKTNGKSTQALIADGSVKGINSANGIAGLDANGYVPLAQLGNLDTTVAEVVTALPTTNIKKHIYLIKDTSGVTQNQYEEYIYTGDTSAAYDASKWEKLGDFRATVDLADYAKKKEAMHSMDVYHTATDIQIGLKGVNDFPLGFIAINAVTSQSAGVMIPSDKTKLDGIANNANNYSLPTASSTTKGGITLGYSQSGKNYPVALDGNGKAYVNVPWTNTTYDLTTYAKKNETIHELILDPPSGDTITFTINYANGDQREIILSAASKQYCGLMSNVDKTKLDNISSGATADSAITTAEIDALFA